MYICTSYELVIIRSHQTHHSQIASRLPLMIPVGLLHYIPRLEVQALPHRSTMLLPLRLGPRCLQLSLSFKGWCWQSFFFRKVLSFLLVYTRIQKSLPAPWAAPLVFDLSSTFVCRRCVSGPFSVECHFCTGSRSWDANSTWSSHVGIDMGFVCVLRCSVGDFRMMLLVQVACLIRVI